MLLSPPGCGKTQLCKALGHEVGRPEDKNWTGAEIKACCRLSVLLEQSLIEAAKNVVPVAVTAAEPIAKLRGWASGRCLDATAGGTYQAAKTKRRRAVIRGYSWPKRLFLPTIIKFLTIVAKLNVGRGL